MKLSGLILAGGKSRRMGRDKAQIIFDNQSFLDNTVRLVENFTNDIVISSNQSPVTYYPVIADIYKNVGPIGGLFTGLQAVKNDFVLVLPVDMPLLNKTVLNYLLEHINPNKKINVFHLNNRPQMLTGIYNKDVLPVIKKQIMQKDYKLQHLLHKVSFKLIDASPYKNVFINVNSPDELNRLNEKNGN